MLRRYTVGAVDENITVNTESQQHNEGINRNYETIEIVRKDV